MKRISFPTKHKTSAEVFDELAELFKPEDYVAATYDFNGIRPQMVVIATENESIVSYLLLKYSGTKEFDEFEIRNFE